MFTFAESYHIASILASLAVALLLLAVQLGNNNQLINTKLELSCSCHQGCHPPKQLDKPCKPVCFGMKLGQTSHPNKSSSTKVLDKKIF